MKFKYGDLVRIRDWNDMEAQFGTAESGAIACKFSFVGGMRHLCGRQFVVRRIDPNDRVIPMEMDLFEDKEGYRGTWSISTDMIELVHEDFEDAQEEDFSAEDYMSVILPR